MNEDADYGQDEADMPGMCVILALLVAGAVIVSGAGSFLWGMLA